MPIEPWNLVFLIGFIIYVVIRGIFEGRAKGNEKMLSPVDARKKGIGRIVPS